MASWHGYLFAGATKFWENLRTFCFINKTLVEVTFLFTYVIEQLLLVTLTYTIHDIALLSFVVSIFAIMVLTTFALHKLLMESRIKVLEQEIHKLSEKMEGIASRARDIFGNYNGLIDRYERLIERKDLNKTKIQKIDNDAGKF